MANDQNLGSSTNSYMYSKLPNGDAFAAFSCRRKDALCDKHKATHRISRAPRNKVNVRSQKVVPACSYCTRGWGFAGCVSRTLNSLNRLSSFSMFLSTSSSTSDTSRIELSRRFTRCKYKSVFVLSTEPSWFSCTLYSSTLMIALVTLPRTLRIKYFNISSGTISNII